jgi:hypothetical protein
LKLCFIDFFWNKRVVKLSRFFGSNQTTPFRTATREIMNKQISKITLLATLGLSASVSLAQVPNNDGYLFDTRGVVARSGFGLCWKTTRWTPAMAIPECDPDLAKKPAPAPAPAATPKPAAQKVTLAADAVRLRQGRAAPRRQGQAG